MDSRNASAPALEDFDVAGPSAAVDLLRLGLKNAGLEGRRCWVEGLGWIGADREQRLEVGEPQPAPAAVGTAFPAALWHSSGPPHETDKLVRRHVLTHWDATISNAVAHRRQARELEQHVDEVVRRISDSYEELTFLRRIAKHIRYCRADQEVTAVADGMLEDTREVVNAEAIFLIGRPASDGQFPVLASQGDVRLAEAAMTWLCQEGEAALWQRPIVRNHPPESLRSPAAEPGLTGCLLVPVANAQVQVGWLLCCNKIFDLFAFEPPSDDEEWAVSEKEFGTHEATLLESVATVLAAQAGNFTLFAEREGLLLDLMHALTGTLDARDPYTRGHSDRVARIATRIGQRLGMDDAECRALHVTGLLHDIGKIAVSDEVLQKPGRLTEEEFAEIKKHPEAGYRILKGIKPLEYTLPGVLHHHEAIDGSGYPHCLIGEQIPLPARILAVADAYDAMTSDRPYRAGMSFERAETILREGAGQQWDTAVVGALLDTIDEVRRLCHRIAEPA